jgi:ketosteroid isomerase-like protein
MKKLLLLAMCATMLYSCGSPQPTEEKVEAVPVDTTPKAVEFADASYIETGKTMFAAIAGGNMEAYLQPFSDNAMYRWNNGDSLAGKQAISDFWNKRRLEEIETLTFSNEIWLPVKVNQPQSVEAPGVWLLSWAKVDATYKNGKSMTQWMHWTIHFNDNNQVDRMNQYLDTAPINAVMPMKK